MLSGNPVAHNNSGSTLADGVDPLENADLYLVSRTVHVCRSAGLHFASVGRFLLYYLESAFALALFLACFCGGRL